MDSSEDKGVRLIVDRGDMDYLDSIAEQHDVEVVEERGFLDPLSVTVLLFGGSAAVGVVAELVERHKGGVVLDLQSSPRKEPYRSKGLPYGIIMIIADDGQVQIEVREPKGMFGQVLDAVSQATVDLGKATIDRLLAPVRAAVGDAGEIHSVTR